MSTPFKSLQGVDVSTQVRTIDIFPTLCEAAGIPVPKEVQGKSLWPVVAQGGKGDDLPAYSESLTPSLQYGWSPLFSLRSAGYQYIDAPRAELYDLKNDPGEQINLNATSPLSAQKMEKALHEIIATSSTGAPVPVAADLDKETIERLASLGYVGAPLPQPSPSNSGKGLIDPKDMFDVYDSIQKAGELNNSEQYVQAAGILESVIKIDPENPQARLQLAAAYVELNRPAEAQEHLDHILKRDPNNIHALICLANILQKQGRPDDVIGLCEKAIQVDQRNTQAYSLIGESYMDENKFDQALPSLEKALAIQPKLTQNRLNLAACLIGLKQYSRAESMLDELIKESPKFPLAHFHLGLLFEEQGEMQKASQAYQDEITLYGNSYRARFNLGRLLLSQGNLQGYLDQMKEVVRIAPQNPLGRLFLARGLLRKGIDNDDVLDMVRQGLSFARTTEQKALGYFLLADLYNRRNQPQIAREALEKADAFKSQLTGRTQ